MQDNKGLVWFGDSQEEEKEDDEVDRNVYEHVYIL